MANKYVVFIVSMVIGYSLPVSWAADNSQTINFAVTLVSPTCDVGQSGLATGNILDFGNIDPAIIIQDPPASLQKSFQLTLSCNTSGSPGQHPKLKMSGTTLTNGNAHSQPYLFNLGGSAAAQIVGFIVKLNSTSPITWAPADANEYEIDLNETAGGTAPASVPIQVGISKGTNTDSVVSGELKAAVTFTFRYG